VNRLFSRSAGATICSTGARLLRPDRGEDRWFAMKEYVPLLQTALWVALALIGLALFRRPLVDRIRLGGSVKAGPFELGDIRDKVADMQRQVRDLNDKVAKLFLLTMASPMYANVRKLASGRFGEYEMHPGLKRDLSHHVVVSPTGLQFVQLRDEIGTS
jgi:hypothetical protein